MGPINSSKKYNGLMNSSKNKLVKLIMSNRH